MRHLPLSVGNGCLRFLAVEISYVSRGVNISCGHPAVFGVWETEPTNRELELASVVSRGENS